MGDIYNSSESGWKRKELRLNTTMSEQRLWMKLRGKQMHGYKFRRQFSVGKFILDFYCSKLKLAIEVDGYSHAGETAEMYDKKRTEYLQSLGIICIRFMNYDVMKNLDGVGMAIWDYVGRIKSIEDPS